MEGRAGLAAVVRRIATDEAFAAALRADPAAHLAEYDLSADDLAALALLLEPPPTGPGLHGIFADSAE
jgi:hypothetical protein